MARRPWYSIWQMAPLLIRKDRYLALEGSEYKKTYEKKVSANSYASDHHVAFTYRFDGI